MSESAAKALLQLAARFEISDRQAEMLAKLAKSSVSLEISGTAVDSEADAVRLHVADSLVGLEIPAITAAKTITDIGSGVGFPGLVIAAMQPQTQITLVDSVRKKMEAAGRLAREIGLENVECVWARVEELGALGSPARETFDVVTARALAPLNVLVEYSAPLLVQGGSLVAWKGDPDANELRDARAAEGELGFTPGELIPTTPFRGSRRRHFYLTKKAMPTGDRYPRRPGTALRKPLAA